MKKTQNDRLSVYGRISKETVRAFQRLAKKDKRSLNKYLELVLEQEVERRKLEA